MKSLWAHWPVVRHQVSSAKHLALFLDYDGTLAPIAAHPSKARLRTETRELLWRLAHQPRVWVALVSGRALSDLKTLVGIRGLCYVGNHGLELQGPKLNYVNPVARASRPLLKQIAGSLKVALQPIPGVWVEDKGLSLSVHFRQVKPRSRPSVERYLAKMLGPYQREEKIELARGKLVLEVRPAVRWHKGTVVNWLLARQMALHGAEGFLPIYLGDDETDEAAFAALKAKGLTISVGILHRETEAQYFLGSPHEVRRFLQKLWKMLQSVHYG